MTVSSIVSDQSNAWHRFLVSRGRRLALRVCLPLLLVPLLLVSTGLLPADHGGVAVAHADATTFILDSPVYGPNSVITISFGELTVNPCNTSFGTTVSDIYIVPQGAVLQDGSNLKGLDPRHQPITVASPFIGAPIFDEPIGFTYAATPTPGRIPVGTYVVVEDVCRDGTFNAGLDTVGPSFQVSANIPSGDPSAIQKIKASSQSMAALMQRAAGQLLVLAGLNYIWTIVTKVGTLVNCTPGPGEEIPPCMNIVSIIQTILHPPDTSAAGLAASLSRHYSGLAADPPDPNFQQAVTLNVTPVAVDFSSPITQATSEMGNATAQTDALTLALLQSFEKYQGAQSGGDPTWALRHAQELKSYAQLLATSQSRQSTAALAFQGAIDSSPVNFDGIATNLVAFQSRVQTTGFTSDEVQFLRSIGYTDTQIQQLRTNFGNAQLSWSRTATDANLQAIASTNATFATGLGSFATTMDPIITTLTAQVSTTDPQARAGGPYTGSARVAMTFDGSASTDGGQPPLTFAWDLTGSGRFTDATGPTPTFTYPSGFRGLAGLRVTNAAGVSNTAYTPVTVADSNQPPTISSSSPAAGEVVTSVGVPASFQVTASDPDGDPVTVSWSVDGQMVATGTQFTFNPTAANVGFHTIQALVSDNKAAAVGTQWSVAVQGNGVPLWTTKAPMPTARAESAFGSIGGRLYVAGGEVNALPLATVEVYDPSTDTWAAKKPMPSALYAAASAVINDRLYVAGGATPNSVQDTLEAYDPTTDVWTTLASMPTPEASAAAANVNGKLYVVGGVSQFVLNNPRNAILQVYDPGSNTWATKSPMPTARASAEAVAINGLLYVVGGTTNNSANSETGVLEVYDPATDMWTSRTPMPTPRDSFAAAFVGGRLYAIGGNLNGGPQTAANESYDPISDTWAPAAPMPTVRAGMASGVIGATIFVVGGATGSGFGVPQQVNEAFGTTSVNAVAPTTTASVLPAPNGAGWNNTPVTVTLSASDSGSGLGIKSITYSATGAQTIASTTASGATATVNITSEGQTTITFFATDNAGNQETPKSLTINLDKTPPTITVAGVQEGDTSTNSVAPTITIADQISGVDPSQTSITLNGQPYSSSTPITPAGAYTLVVNAADKAGNPASQTVHFRVVHTTALSYTGDVGGDYNDPATLSAVLVDSSANPGTPIPGVPVTLSLGSQTCTGTTDSSGRAACTITPNQAAGTYALGAAFNGNALYLASNASGTFTERLEETALAITSSPTLANRSVVVKAVLTEDGQTPIAGRTVSFGAGGVTATGTADATGTATATLALGPGQYSLSASFAGDGFYQPATATTQTLYVYQPTTFVIWGGNLPIPAGQPANVTIGQDYTFWGAQWAKQVQSGNFQANPSFKGFATSVSGATWTSDPGASSGPPATVASYISVIVTTSATKNGNVESGNIAEMVVLKVDNPAGYQPNPDSPGSGILVAVVQ